MTMLNFVFSFTDQGVAKIMQTLLGYMQDFSRAAQEQEASMTQLGAALRATGKDAQISAEEIAGYAAELQKTTKFGDEAIIASSKWFAQMPRLDARNMEEYQRATTDLAEVMGTDLKTAAQVLARALEDPRRASRALRRANIMLSTQERRMLETFDEANETLMAQEVIMNAVQASVGGAAQEMANTVEGVRGQIRGLSEDLKEHIGKNFNDFLFPILRKAKEELESLSQTMGDMNTAAAAEGITQWEQAGWGVVQSWEAWLEGAKEIYSYLKDINEELRYGVDAAFGSSGQVSEALGILTQSQLGSVWTWFQKIGEQRAKNERVEAELRAKGAKAVQEEEERIAEEKKKIFDAEEERIRKRTELEKKRKREWEAFARESLNWVERMRKTQLTPAEKFVEGVDRINMLLEKGLVTVEQAKEVNQAIVKQYWEQVDAAGALEKAQTRIEKARKDEAKRAEAIRKMDARIKKERGKQEEFSSSMTTLSGLWDSMATAAMSTKTNEKDQLNELIRQREILVRQHQQAQRERVMANKNMVKLREVIEEDRRGMMAVFAR